MHAAWDQVLCLRRIFPERFVAEVPDDLLPLFPSVEGNAVSKISVVATLRKAAKLLGIPISNADGSQKITGHSLRTTGA